MGRQERTREAGQPRCWHHGGQRRKPFREETCVSLRKQVMQRGLRVHCVGEPWSPHSLSALRGAAADLQLVFTDISHFGVHLFPCHVCSQRDHYPSYSHDGHPHVLLCTRPTLLWTSRLTVWGFIWHLVLGSAAPLLFQIPIFFITGSCKIPTCSM